ncbi:MAG: OPT/YSL family transporter, partial [Caldimonas sp.]
VLDAVLLPSPYALSFGGFVNLPTSLWFGAGGVVAGALDTLARARSAHGKAAELPQDMTATSLFGGGLIAGDALAALGLGLVALGALVVGGQAG